MEPAAIVYVTETVLAPSHRSLVLSLLSPIFYGGVFVSYLIGFVAPWRHQALCMSALAAVGCAAMFAVPETPCWLLMKNQDEAAGRSLRWLMNGRGNVDQELGRLRRKSLIAEGKEKAAPEADKGERGAANNGARGDEDGGQWRHRKEGRQSVAAAVVDTGSWKPFLLIATFLLLQQLSGYKILVFYTVCFYDSFGTSIDGYTSSLVFGGLVVLSSLMLAAIINHFGRRTLMTASASGVCVACGTAAAHLYFLGDEARKPPLCWLPVACIWLDIVFGTLGLNTLTWIMAGEMFPTRLRGAMVGLVWAVGFAFMFVSVKMYPALEAALHIHGILAMFSAVAFVAILCSLFVLPETRGKTLQEIERLWLPAPDNPSPHH